ncbi:TetR/AcrR family transcriptional regulator [Cellulomonas sp. McL0617]|uniref:TetR/AcrR family transcriptional regulator n=1 Tax=Cellulomonas sp. McL0617 TaxID=3415675 RepID=UPI003CFB1B12
MEDEGRRERKKRVTTEAIEQAAIDLALEVGLRETTVEAISERADVTSRTFFNYFASKEDAVLGLSRLASPVFELPSTRTEVSAFDQVRDHMRGLLLESTAAYSGRIRDRRRLMGLHPELIGRDYLHLVLVGERLRAWLSELLQVEDPSVDSQEIATRAITILQVLNAAYQIASQCWEVEDLAGPRLAELFDEALVRIASVTHPAVAS